MSVTSLSKEILAEIFKHLSQGGIKECTQVCKAWNSATNLIPIDTVKLSDRSAVIKYLESCKSKSQHSHLHSIKTLVIGTYSLEPNTLSTQELESLLANLPPRVQQLQLDNTLIPIHDFLRKKLYNIIIDNCKQLKSLHLDFFIAKDLAVDVFWAFRSVLTEFNVKEFSRI